MKSTLALLVAIAGLILLPGCLELSEPVSDPMLSSANTDLCGVWQRAPGSQGMPEHLYVGVHPGEDGTPQGLMEFNGVTYDDASKKIETSQMSFSTSDVNGAHYANLLAGETKPDLSTKQGYDAWKAQATHQVLLVKYEVKGGQLMVWMGSDEAFKALKTSKAIDDSTASLITYLKANGDAKIFTDDDKVVYTRVK